MATTTFANGEIRGFLWGKGAVSNPPSVCYVNGSDDAPSATSWKVYPAGSDRVVRLEYLGGERVGNLIQVTVTVDGTPHTIKARIVS